MDCNINLTWNESNGRRAKNKPLFPRAPIKKQMFDLEKC